MYQLRFDFRLKLDSVMEKTEAKGTTVGKFREMIEKIIEEESSAVVYLYLTTSSASSIVAKARIPKTYTYLRRYLPGIRPPLKNSDLVYGQIYTSTGTYYTDWRSNFLEWMKENGHGFSIKFVRDERAIPLSYLLYTHTISNTNWYQTFFSKKK